MLKTYLISTLALLISFFSLGFGTTQAQTQQLAFNTGTAFTVLPDYPARLVIPAIALNNKVIPVGINSKGQMSVPSGATKNVGWYKNGTVPGTVGSAVIDAHVFAAFSKLHKLKPGNDIYVQTANNKSLHFVVSSVKTYALADLPPSLLFNQADTERLNLITCAGTYVSKNATYDKRLVVYTTLVHDA